MSQKDAKDKKQKKQVATVSRRSILIRQIAEILSKKDD